MDLSKFALVEPGQERRPSGRVDHTFTYERTDETLKEGRYRLRLVVSGDRLTEVTHFIKIPEAFTRRYASMRSANDIIGIGSTVGLALLYVIGGIGVGMFFMMRKRYVLWKHAAIWGVAVGGLQTLATLNEFPLIWMSYDTAIPRSTFLAQQIAFLGAGFVGFSVFFGLSFMAAETLSRPAFPHHPQLWRVWAKEPGASIQILGRTVSGYLLVSVFFAYDVLLYLVMTKVFGWWSPAEALIHPDVLATYVPWLSAIANSFQAGFWEEALFRAVPIAGAALIGERVGQRKLFIVLGFIVQAIIFGAGHAPYPNAAGVRAAGRADHSVDRLRAALPLFRAAARHHPALRVRRRLVRAADLPRQGAGDLVPAADGRRADARPAVDRAVAPRRRWADGRSCRRPS